MSDSVQFDSLQITRLRGFEPPGFALEELSEGINVVYGPNASGKSTVAVALRKLLWPDDLADAGEMVSGRLAVGGKTGRVDIDSGRIQRTGSADDRLVRELPSADHRDRYHLYLHDLLEAENDNQSFAEAIRRDAVGGFDVDRAADALEFGEVQPRTGKTTKRVENLREKVRERRRKQEGLRDRERELEQLRADLDEATRAGRRAEQVEVALDILEARSDLRETRRELEAYPEVHDEIRGDEIERATELGERADRLEDEIADARRVRSEAEKRLAENPLPDDGVDETFVETLDERVDRFESAVSELEAARDDLAGARQERGRLARKLDSIADPGRAAELDPDDLEPIDRYLNEVDELRGERRALETFRHVFENDQVPGRERVEQLDEGAKQLRRWLRARAGEGEAETDAPEPDRTFRRVSMAVAAVLIAAGTVYSAMFHLAALLFVLLGAVLLAVYLLVGGDEADKETGRTEVYRRDFREESSLDEPDSWTMEGVEQHLKAIEEQLVKVKTARAKDRIWSQSDFDEAAVADRERQIEERRSRLVDSLGLSPDTETGNAGLARTVDHLRRLQRTDAAVEEARTRVESREERRDELLDEVGGQLAEVGLDHPSTVSEAKGTLKTVRRAEKAHDRATRDRRQARKRLHDAREELDQVRDERRELFEQLGLERGANERLAELCDEHDDWEKAADDVREAQVRLDNEKERTDKFEDFDDSLLEKSPPELESMLEELEEVHAERDELRDEISRIEQRIGSAKSAHDLEEANAEYRQVRDELAADRRDDYRQAAGHALARFVADETRDRELPEVFHRARDMFQQVTKGQYRLEFDGGQPPTFRAFDTVGERMHSLDELSSGTRLQLLLAVRVAFVEKEERDLAVPLVFDETLANSDDLRARSLIDVIRRFADRGRQVFYFTAQRDEVRKWRSVLDEEGENSARFIPLADESADDGEQWTDDLPAEAIASPDAVPAPDGDSHEDYGDRLDRPSWSPRKPVGSLHLWYLVEDVDRLHRLLEAGFERWGQLEALGESGGLAAAGIDEEAYRRIAARARGVETFGDAWSRGRGEPVDQSVLEETDAVTDNFIDQVTELCEQVDGDGRRIVEGLDAGEVNRFRQAKVRELEEFFEQHGYIEPADTLAAAEIRTRVLADLADAIEEGIIERVDIDRLLRRVGRSGPGQSVQ